MFKLKKLLQIIVHNIFTLQNYVLLSHSRDYVSSTKNVTIGYQREVLITSPTNHVDINKSRYWQLRDE